MAAKYPAPDFPEFELGRGNLLCPDPLNGHDSEAYLRAVLTLIAGHPVTRIDVLLP